MTKEIRSTNDEIRNGKWVARSPIELALCEERRQILHGPQNFIAAKLQPRAPFGDIALLSRRKAGCGAWTIAQRVYPLRRGNWMGIKP
jgi:hypothetical protein